MNKDRIIRVTAGNGSIRGFFADTKNLCQESRKIHNTSPTVTTAMGRALTATSMMGLMLKNEGDLITMKISGDGPMKGVLITGDSHGNVKGYPYVNAVETYLNHKNGFDVGGAIGYGTLQIIKDMGLKEPYSSQVPLITGEIGEDLTQYFLSSEQTPSAVGLGVNLDNLFKVKASKGFIVQLMPFAKDETIAKLEENINNLTELYKYETIEELAKDVFKDLDMEILHESTVSFKCNCSYEKIEKALLSLGKKELSTILNEDKKASVNCYFCNKTYDFNELDLTVLISKLDK